VQLTAEIDKLKKQLQQIQQEALDANARLSQIKKTEDAKDYEQRKNEIISKSKGPTSVLDKKG
jgi:DNA-binding protein YbaB